MTARTDAEKAQDYTAMGHSVALINAIIAGTEMAASIDLMQYLVKFFCNL